MKKIFCLLLALCLALCSAFALAEGTTVTVKGSATVYADPDQFSLTASATCHGETMTAVQQELSGIIASATEALLSAGLREEDVTTSGYSCWPDYDYSGEEAVLTGYQATHTLAVCCDDLSLVDAVVTALSNNGMTEIYSISFDVKDKSALYAQALTEAVQAAQAKAQVLAAAMGLAEVSPVSVTETSSGSVAYNVKAVASSADNSGDISTGISTGSVSVSAAVEMVFSVR